jgi:hypothetical protein
VMGSSAPSMSAVHSKDLPAVSCTSLGQAMLPTRVSGNRSFSHLVSEADTWAWSTVSRAPTVIVQPANTVAASSVMIVTKRRT